MDWSKIKAKLLAKKEQIKSYAQKIKTNEEIDVSIEVVLDTIPIVGPFLSKYWSKIETDKPQQLETIAQVLEIMSKQQSAFDSVRTLLNEFGDELQHSSMTLDIIVGRVASITDDIQEIKPQIERIVDVTKYKFVTDPLGVAGSLIDDHARRKTLIDFIKSAFDHSDQELTPEKLYTYGRMFMVANLLDWAEACLLELHNQFPDHKDALVSLATLYQRRAHEYIIQNNFGFAEEVLKKAQAYVKAADQDVDIFVDLQFAYGFKELGQAYRADRPIRLAAEALRKARQRFGGVLAVDKFNVSALNGMGNIETIEGRLEEGIKYMERAVTIEPNYVEAWYDLAQSYLQLSQTQMRFVTSSETRKKGVKAYRKVKELVRKGIGLPIAAQKHLDKVFRTIPELKDEKPESA